MCESGICDTKLAISLKRSSLQPKYYNSCTAYLLVTNLNFCLLFQGEQTFLTADIWHTICQSAIKFGNVTGLANRALFSEVRDLWSGGPVTPCGDMHQSFTDALVKRCFDNFPMFADSFSVFFYSPRCPRIRCRLSVQVPCIAR